MQSPFRDVERKPLLPAEGMHGLDYLDRVSGMQVGQGTSVMRVDESGLWLGAKQFANAPFRVDMNGNMTFTSPDGSLVIDAVNNRIVIYDSSDVPRVLIGFQEDGF